MTIETAIAMNRFGLGARPSGTTPDSPKDWLKSQLGQYNPEPAALAGQPSRADIAASFREYQLDRKDRRQR